MTDISSGADTTGYYGMGYYGILLDTMGYIPRREYWSRAPASGRAAANESRLATSFSPVARVSPENCSRYASGVGYYAIIL